MLGASADPKGHWAPDFAALRQNPAQARGLKKVEEKKNVRLLHPHPIQGL